MTTVAILGAGDVGRALGERVLTAGSTVTFGVRDPDATEGRLTGVLTGASVKPSREAVAEAEIIMIAVPANAALDVARSAGGVSGRILVDCTNPLRWDNGPVWSPPAAGSVAQALAQALPDIHVVKGFNHFGAEIQKQPEVEGGPADAFFAGDSDEAKETVMDLAGRMGFRPHDAGPLRNAALLENLAVLWIQLATAKGSSRNFAFRMERQT
jgi:NADPH-dependent F420 reductase